MKIADIEFGKYPIFLAPMEDVTDEAFRLLCKRYGADMVYTEFVSSDALIRQVNKSMQKLAICDEERPVAIQIYGRDVDSMTEAARIVENAKERAKAMKAQAEAEGQALCQSTEAELSQTLEGMLEQIRAKTEEHAERVREATREEATSVAAIAKLNRKSAEKIVIRGLMSKCR